MSITIVDAMFKAKMEVCGLSEVEGFLREVARELRKLKEEQEELHILRFAADRMRSLRRRVLSSRYD